MTKLTGEEVLRAFELLMLRHSWLLLAAHTGMAPDKVTRIMGERAAADLTLASDENLREMVEEWTASQRQFVEEFNLSIR